MTQPSFKSTVADPLGPSSHVDRGGGAGTAPDRQVEALARVASVVAHELTNVLQVLASSLDRLTVGGEPDASAVRAARASVERGTRLARQLQTFAQTSPTRLEQHPIHHLMAQWMGAFEEAVGPQHPLELRLSFSGFILVDPDQLQTAISNLLINAREASAPGTPILLELARADANTAYACRISVIDRGEGMTAEIARQAPAPFFSTRPPGKGMGLGLTIARMVTEMHGGDFALDTAFGRGTTVTLRLPSVPQPGLSAGPGVSLGERALPVPGGVPPPASEPRREPDPPRLAGRLLVVDDEEAIAEYFRIILTAERYEVHVVCSARDALERFGEDPSRYDAVVLDMILRDGSGAELYRRFRQIRPTLGVVVVTGFSDAESLAPIRADGQDVLFKPCPRADVIKAVARAVAKRRAADQAQA